MNVQIIRGPSSDGVIEFSAAHGSGKCLLSKGSQQPTIDESYSAELDIDGEIKPGENAIPAECEEFRLYSSGDSVGFVGVIESRDDDGLIYFRVGSDCLIMLDAPNVRSIPGMWMHVHVPSSRVTLHLVGSSARKV